MATIAEEEVFEDAFEDAVEEHDEPKEQSNSSNNSSGGKKFKIPLSKRLSSMRDKRKNRQKQRELQRKEDEKAADNTAEDECAPIPISEGIEEAKLSVDLFLSNKFEDAKNVVEPLSDRSIYHALGYSVFMYLKAVMTFEMKDIEEASNVATQCCDTINRFRRKTGFTESLGRMISKTDYDAYTEEELHAEICYGECLLIKACLTFCEDETLVSFVKAGFKVRACFQSFREGWNALNERDWEAAPHDYKGDFESGVRLGIGSFNLLISLLPARIMRLLEFIGFQGNREAGLAEVLWANERKDDLRQFLAALILLGFNLILNNFIGSSECDFELCKRILDENLEKYPNGAFFTFFKGRYHVMRGEIPAALVWYEKSVASQDDWKQLHQVCYWELYWGNMFMQNWTGAMTYAQKLFEESKWSKCMYAYQKAATLSMLGSDLTQEQKDEHDELMRNVPLWKQRIAGKSIPMEKFAVRKAERYFDQEGYLVLPGLELIYVWNGFAILGQDYRLTEKMYILVQSEKKKVEARPESKYYNEDICLVNLLLGVCLKQMKSPLQAEECLKEVITFTGKLKADAYLIPYSMFEYGQILRDQGHFDVAMETLESAKNDFKDFSLHSRLHFRIQAVQDEIRAAIAAGGRRPRASSPVMPAGRKSSFKTTDVVLPEFAEAVAAAGGGKAAAGEVADAVAMAEKMEKQER